MKRIGVLIFVLLAHIALIFPQNNQRELYVISESSLPLVYGWVRNEKNDKWTVKEKEIKDLDKFKSYTILRIQNKKDEFIAIVKETELNKKSVYDFYILDYEDYKEQVSRWEENTILRFKILMSHQVATTKKDAFPYEQLKKINLSSPDTSTDRNFTFQYKFMNDDTVKFLFYVEDYSSSSHGLMIKDPNKVNLKYLGNESLYDSYFYKTTLTNFLKFIDRPLK